LTTCDDILTNLAVEKSRLRNTLETFTFESFSEYLKDWMMSGRYVWYITGNMTFDQARAIVKETSKTLDLKPIEVTDLPEVRIIRLKDKASYSMQIPLADPKNQNSCVMTHYEVGPKDSLKLKLVD